MLKEARQYSLSTVQDEVRALISRGTVGRTHKIYSLSKHFGDREWSEVERALTAHDYLLRDSVCDLIGKEAWLSD